MTANMVDVFYEEFGRKVRIARDRAQVTQADLAEMIDLSRSSVANLEAGRQRVQLHILLLIAKSLSVEPRELLPDTDVEDTVTLHLLDQHLDPYTAEDRSFVLSALRGYKP